MLQFIMKRNRNLRLSGGDSLMRLSELAELSIQAFRLSFLTLLPFLASPSCARADVRQDVEQFIKSYEQKKLWDDKVIRNHPPQEILNALEHLKHTPDRGTRLLIVRLASSVLLRSREYAVRQNVISFLLSMTKDPDEGVVRSTARFLSSAKFNLMRSDFSNEMRDLILELVKHPTPDDQSIRLAGVADVQAAKERIKELATIPKGTAGVVTWRDPSWPAYVALARLGDRKAIQLVIDMVQADPDEQYRRSALAEDLAYIRQPQTTEVLIEYLFYEGKTPEWKEFGVQMGGIKYASYAVKQLALIIEGFPFAFRELSYTNEEIEKAREWINANRTNLKIKR